VKELAVELNFNEASSSITIKGTQSNLRKVKVRYNQQTTTTKIALNFLYQDEILKLKEEVLEKKIQVQINKHIFTLLQEHVTGELGAEACCTVRDVSSVQDLIQEGISIPIFVFVFVCFLFSLCSSSLTLGKN
jgi:hypothetical protein